MAKDDRGKVKMTVIHFETESDNATLQENIRAIAHTVSRALVSPQQLFQRSAQITAGSGGTAESISDIDEPDSVDTDPIPPLHAPSSSRKQGGARQYRTPLPIDLDLTSGDLPLKSFLEQRKPDNDIKRYLAIAYWLKTNRKVEEVTMDHTYTCYRHMGWQVPGDAALPFRVMKRKQYGWVKAGSTKGAYVINHLGENKVEQMSNA